MPELFGHTRNVVKQRYALLTPSGFVPGYLPGWEKAVCCVLISPAMGAQFSQLLVTLEQDGQCTGNTGANQYFIYVVEGNLSVLLDEKRHRLGAGGYAYVPPGKDMQIKSGGAGTRILVVQKQYQSLPGTTRPAGPLGNGSESHRQPVSGHHDP